MRVHSDRDGGTMFLYQLGTDQLELFGSARTVTRVKNSDWLGTFTK